jgi:hypothetical protein
MSARPPSRFARPRLERLEDRAVPAVVNWTLGANGDFADPNDWTVAGTTTHRVPTAGDDVVIPGQFSVTSSVNESVNSLSANNLQVIAGRFTVTQTFTQTAGTLTVAAGATLQANVQVTGGTLAGGGAVIGNVAGAFSPGGSGPGALSIIGNVNLGGTYFADVGYPASPSVHWINSSGRNVADLTDGQTFVTDFKGSNDLNLKLTGSIEVPHNIALPALPGNNPGYLYGFEGSSANGTGNGDTGTVRFLRTDHDSTNSTLDFQFAQPLTPLDRLVIEDVDSNERYHITAYVRNGTSYQAMSMANWVHQNYSGRMGVKPDDRWASWDGATGMLDDSSNGADLDNPVTVLQPDQPIDRVVIDKTASTNGDSGFTFIRGPVAGTDYDQLAVAGTVTLSGPLVANVTSYVAPGASIRLIDNDGTDPVVGTFAGLAEGATLTLDGQAFTISYAAGDGNDVWLTRLATPPRVLSTQVNGGALQRSMVTSLTVAFNAPVTFATTPAAAFTLTRIGGGTVNFTAAASNDTGFTVVTLTNFSGALTAGGSLIDGRYALTALAGQISAYGFQLDGDGNGADGDNYNFADSGSTVGNQLYRLYGDADGNRVVNVGDLTLFRTAFGSGDLTFDSDFNGVVNQTDLAAFRTNFGVVA